MPIPFRSPRAPAVDLSPRAVRSWRFGRWRVLVVPVLVVPVLAVLALGLSGCSPSAPAPESLVGQWRAVLDSPGGELPFVIEIENDRDWLRATVLNGKERAPVSALEIEGTTVVFRFDWYDSEITAEWVEDGVLRGEWRKTAAAGEESRLDFEARRGVSGRFHEPETRGSAAVDDVGGHWAVEFTDEDGTEPARAELVQFGVGVTGTFLTPTGDYRFLEGSFDQGLLRLSTFDGAHAFLFHARALDDGSLEGDFWSRDTYHATWTARPVEESEAILPDAWSAVGLTNGEGDFSFRFENVDGSGPISLDDERFAGKVVLVNIFGSWCPNCNDEAPLLAAWYRRFRDQGLEVVGLAYELSGDPERDRRMVERFAERHGVQYPLLLAGTSDKAEAAETLPDLDRVLAFPTSIFLGRDGKVRKIHSGFAGPGTGRHHAELVAELEGLLRELLAEPV